MEDGTISNYAKALLLILAYGPNVGSVHMESIRGRYDRLYQMKSFSVKDHPDSLNFVSRVTDKKVAFAVASLFTPFFDFDGVEVPHGSLRELLPFMTLDVVPNIDQTIISCAFVRRFGNPLAGIIRRFQQAATDEDFLVCMWELPLRNCETLVVVPDAWKALTEQDQGLIEDLFTDTMMHRWETWPNLSVPRFD